MTNILITGGAGYIGSHVCHLLIDQGYNITCIDNLITGNKELLPKEVKLEVFDISEKEKVANLIKSNNFDLVMHFAGLIRVDESVEQPDKYRDFNFLKAKKFLETCFENDLKKIIFSSTAAVYGNPKVFPVCENNSTAPISPYGYHKLAAENLCKEFNHIYNIQTLIVRIFSAYGPGLKKQLFWDLHQKYQKSNRVELFGTGEETRDFIFIDDLVKALELVMVNSSFENDIINIGSGYSTKIKNVAKVFFDNSSKPVDYFFSNTALSGAPNNWSVNIDKLKSFGFEPQYSISKGVKKTSLWLQKNYPLE